MEKRNGAERNVSPCPSGLMPDDERTCGFNEVRWWCRTQCQRWLEESAFRILVIMHHPTLLLVLYVSTILRIVGNVEFSSLSPFSSFPTSLQISSTYEPPNAGTSEGNSADTKTETPFLPSLAVSSESFAKKERSDTTDVGHILSFQLHLPFLFFFLLPLSSVFLSPFLIYLRHICKKESYRRRMFLVRTADLHVFQLWTRVASRKSATSVISILLRIRLMMEDGDPHPEMITFEGMYPPSGAASFRAMLAVGERQDGVYDVTGYKSVIKERPRRWEGGEDHCVLGLHSLMPVTIAADFVAIFLFIFLLTPILPNPILLFSDFYPGTKPPVTTRSSEGHQIAPRAKKQEAKPRVMHANTSNEDAYACSPLYIVFSQRSSKMRQ
ncbi:protein spitz [Caerostris extrusa]|uniref:Protein spitz n=1 Tax=Caerostris extrusa TaxID=172846 RepID=A0AAV4V904_CAEEX|nr:protein spitz [Caerostris extrusa]